MPSQLRRMLRQQGRDLHADFLQLLPYQLPPVRIQRWSWRRIALTVATLCALLLVAPGSPPTCSRRRCEPPRRSAPAPSLLAAGVLAGCGDDSRRGDHRRAAVPGQRRTTPATAWS